MTADPLRIFIGWDDREQAAYHVLAHSIIRRATVPVAITPIRREHIRGFYTRERGPLESTDFSMTRFLVPALCGYEGYGVFMDCDMLCRMDMGELWFYIAMEMSESARNRKAILCCQHDYQPSETVKFLGNIQTAYPKKNWSSFMIFRNDACRALTPEYVNSASGLDLHRFNWLADTGGDAQIGKLPLTWNWLVGEYAPNPEAKILHWTKGGPWLKGYETADHADEWFAEYDRTIALDSERPQFAH